MLKKKKKKTEGKQNQHCQQRAYLQLCSGPACRTSNKSCSTGDRKPTNHKPQTQPLAGAGGGVARERRQEGERSLAMPALLLRLLTSTKGTFSAPWQPSILRQMLELDRDGDGYIIIKKHSLLHLCGAESRRGWSRPRQ